MGGSSGGKSRRRTSSGTGSTGQGSAGGAAGGSGGSPACPAKISASVAAPAPGIAAGSWLDVVLDILTQPNRVVLVDSAGATVGSISGIPGLATLIACLASGVAYRAYVDRINGGRVDVTLVRQ